MQPLPYIITSAGWVRCSVSGLSGNVIMTSPPPTAHIKPHNTVIGKTKEPTTNLLGKTVLPGGELIKVDA